MEFGVSIALYTVMLMISLTLLLSFSDSPWQYAIAVLPIIPAIMVTVAVLRGLKQLDEMQKHIQLMSFAISFVIVGLTTFTYGFLENTGLPHIPYVWIFPFMIVSWGLTTPLVSRLYQ